jgi:hypothetical protein
MRQSLAEVASMPMRPTPGGLLLSAACDVRERHLRLLQGVNELRRTSDLGARELLKDTEQRIKQILERYECKIAETLGFRDVENSPDDPDTWESEYLPLCNAISLDTLPPGLFLQLTLDTS